MLCKHLCKHPLSLTQTHMQSLTRTLITQNPLREKKKKLSKEESETNTQESPTVICVREKNWNETVPPEASVWWEQGGTPAEACTVYPELFSDCFLTELSVCMRQREGETACVYVCEAEGGDTTPPSMDWASLTGWRGRWGHRNKANTHTHIFLRLLCPRFSFSFPPLRCHPSTTCSKTSIPQRLAPSFCLVFPPSTPPPPVFTQPAKL